jgi:hypothetical protein
MKISFSSYYRNGTCRCVFYIVQFKECHFHLGDDQTGLVAERLPRDKQQSGCDIGKDK